MKTTKQPAPRAPRASEPEEHAALMLELAHKTSILHDLRHVLCPGPLESLVQAAERMKANTVQGLNGRPFKEQVMWADSQNHPTFCHHNASYAGSLPVIVLTHLAAITGGDK